MDDDDGAVPMKDYKDDAERFYEDRTHQDNLSKLQQCYGSEPMKTIRGREVSFAWRDGKLKQLPSAVDFRNPHRLSDPELAVLVITKLDDWESLEDVTDALG